MLWGAFGGQERRDGIPMLKHHWTNCVDTKEDYIEKIEKLSCFSKSFWVRFKSFRKTLVYKVSLGLYVVITYDTVLGYHIWISITKTFLYHIIPISLNLFFWYFQTDICLPTSAFSFSIALVFYPYIILIYSNLSYKSSELTLNIKLSILMRNFDLLLCK